MTKVKNITSGPKGIRLSANEDGAPGEIFMLEPGQSKDLDIAKGEEKQTDWFEFGGKAAKSDGDSAKADPASAEDIKAAIALLEKDNDEHWTAAGAPAVDAVAELAGKPVTRAAITEASPEAKRPTE